MRARPVTGRRNLILHKPNSLCAFPQTPRSFHGVEPLTQEDALRDLLLFDLKIQTPSTTA
jgi:hypothetical protein